MIVRILTEGQWEFPDDQLDRLNVLDAAVDEAVAGADQVTFAQSFAALLHAVREQGTRLEDDSFEESDLILPPSDASLEEVRDLLTEEGLVPDR
jgi:hypothetical protein